MAFAAYLQIDPDVVGKTQLHRPREHFNGGVRRKTSPLEDRAKLAEIGVEGNIELARWCVRPDDRDQFVLADRPLTLRYQERESQTPLPPRKIALLDEHGAMLQRYPPGQIDACGRQGFANLPARFLK